RAAPRRRDGGRRDALCPRRRGRGGVVDRATDPRRGHAGVRVRARKLGTGSGRRAHARGRRLAHTRMISGRTHDVVVLPSVAALMEAAAERLVARAAAAIGTSGRFTLALAGGSAPRRLYELLATPRYGPRVDWSRVHAFWGDERCVAPDHRDANYRMAREALLEHVPI